MPSRSRPVKLDKILAIDPNQINARSARMMQALELGQLDAARDELGLILEHDDLLAFLRSDPKNLEFLTTAAREFAYKGLTREALRLPRAAHGLHRSSGNPGG